MEDERGQKRMGTERETEERERRRKPWLLVCFGPVVLCLLG